MHPPKVDRNAVQILEGIIPTELTEGCRKEGLGLSPGDDEQDRFSNVARSYRCFSDQGLVLDFRVTLTFSSWGLTDSLPSMVMPISYF